MIFILIKIPFLIQCQRGINKNRKVKIITFLLAARGALKIKMLTMYC